MSSLRISKFAKIRVDKVFLKIYYDFNNNHNILTFVSLILTELIPPHPQLKIFIQKEISKGVVSAVAISQVCCATFTVERSFLQKSTVYRRDP